MRRLKIIKNIELRKNNSLLNINMKERIKNYQRKHRDLQKIYRYYFSKNKIEAKLLNQQISKMKNDLNKKQYEEKNNYINDFYRNYPSEDDYNKQIKNFMEKINKYKKENKLNEVKKYEEMKDNFLNKKHNEYLEKMGIEYEEGLNKLKEKFRNENEEQRLKIKKIILNKKIGEIEKQNNLFNNKRYGGNDELNISQDNIYSFYYGNNFLKEDNKNRLCSKVFKFGGRGNPYRTIII